MDADELGKIEASLNSGSFDNALISALTLWRRTRDSDVADLVEALATKADAAAALPKLPRSPKEATQEAWMKLAKKVKTKSLHDQAFALSALLPLLHRSMPIQERVAPYYDNASKARVQSWRTRLSALADLEDDPRTSVALITFLRDAPFEMGDPFTGRWLYDPAIEIIERIADRRAAPHLRALIDSPPAKTQNLRDHLLQRLPLAIDAIEKTAKSFEAVSEESLDRKRVTELRDQLGIVRKPAPGTIGGTSEADLIQQIVAAKTEAEADAARAVLIDSWLERGDPRGELATTKDEKRQRALIRAHDKEWVGPDLAHVLELRTYRHGLLDSARLASTSAANSAGWAKAANAPQLATLRALDKGNANEKVYTQFLTSEAMLSINELTATSLEMLKVLASRETSRRIHTLTLDKSIGMARGEPLRVIESSANFSGVKKTRFIVKKADVLLGIATSIEVNWSKPTRDRHELVVGRFRSVSDPQHIAQWLHYAKELAPLPLGVEIFWYPDTIDMVMRADADTGKLSLEVTTLATAPFTNVLAQLRDIERITFVAKGDKALSAPTKLASAIEATGVKMKNVSVPAEWKRALISRKSK